VAALIKEINETKALKPAQQAMDVNTNSNSLPKYSDGLPARAVKPVRKRKALMFTLRGSAAAILLLLGTRSRSAVSPAFAAYLDKVLGLHAAIG
jgi:hypothetical protein